ncbi:hypothetical protein [Streptomyces chartreusis]
MRIKKLALAATVLAAATTASVLVPASDAAALNQVKCNRKSYAKTHYNIGNSGNGNSGNTKKACYANSGNLYPSNMVRFTKLWSGNNDIILTFEGGKKQFLPRHHSQTWPRGIKIRILRILP